MSDSITESLSLLKDMFKNKDWFAGAGTDELGRLVVYTHAMNMDTMTSIPDRLNGHYIVVHFATAMPVAKPKLSEPPQEPDEYFVPGAHDIASLVKELERLERICGSHNLQDIFYEIHDGKNAVTDLRYRFPEVWGVLEPLYMKYGFDIIYEELDG